MVKLTWCNGCKNFILTNLKGLQQNLNAIFGAGFGGGVILGEFGDKKIRRGAGSK